MGPRLRLLGLLVAVGAIAAAVLAVQRPWRAGSPPPASAPAPTATAGPGALSATPTPASAASTPGAPTSAATSTVAPTPRRPAPPAGAEDAPELEGIHAWINSGPLSLAGLRGKVVLIDFWTYTCVNCIRTFPYLKQWHESYRDRGLVIIGVHSPEFQFERELANVQRAVNGFGLKYAVAMDNDFKTWNNFRNRYWPAKYLIDKDGYVRYRHFGEGSYAETEERIQALLQETGAAVAVGSAIDRQVGESDRDTSDKMTAELYLGYKRAFYYSYLGNPEGYQRDAATRYHDYGLRGPDQFYLHGYWTVTDESADHARSTPGYEDYIALKYSARSVNLVIMPKGDASIRSLATLDGAPLTAANKGDDVVIDPDGKSYLVVREPRMYSLVKDREFATHDLKIYADSEGFSAFAFTFGP